ncbi:MAG: hypothetical protein WD601_06730, partial [Pseudohongiellaceae bacterium]
IQHPGDPACCPLTVTGIVVQSGLILPALSDNERKPPSTLKTLGLSHLRNLFRCCQCIQYVLQWPIPSLYLQVLMACLIGCPESRVET